MEHIITALFSEEEEAAQAYAALAGIYRPKTCLTVEPYHSSVTRRYAAEIQDEVEAARKIQENPARQAEKELNRQRNDVRNINVRTYRGKIAKELEDLKSKP